MRVMIIPVLVFLALLMNVSGILSAAGLFQPPPTEEFVPIDQLPPEEQLPAAPLLVAAYAFVWVAVLGYLWSIWRRLAKVEQELGDLERRTAERK